MPRKILAVALGATILAALCPSIAIAQSRAAKIAQAMAAGPSAVTRNATIKDRPGKDGKMAVLREGTNGWLCVPSDAPTKYKKNDSMCLDAQWQEWLASAFEGRAPKITSVGYAYMLTANEWGSNTDPMGAKEPTATNQWHKQGPHVMVLYPDSKLLEGVPTVPSTTGPYVMMAGTPHAHVMWPIR